MLWKSEASSRAEYEAMKAAARCGKLSSVNHHACHRLIAAEVTGESPWKSGASSAGKTHR